MAEQPVSLQLWLTMSRLLAGHPREAWKDAAACLRTLAARRPERSEAAQKLLDLLHAYGHIDGAAVLWWLSARTRPGPGVPSGLVSVQAVALLEELVGSGYIPLRELREFAARCGWLQRRAVVRR